MAFVTIPDWQSFENQGANIDAPPELNAGYLRVGWMLDTQARFPYDPLSPDLLSLKSRTG